MTDNTEELVKEAEELAGRLVQMSLELRGFTARLKARAASLDRERARFEVLRGEFCASRRKGVA